MLTDLRIPVIFGELAEAGPQDAVLTDAEAPGATASFAAGIGHPAGCTCCVARGEAGRALARLLHARARNQVPYFTRVIAVLSSEAARSELLDALELDLIASTCFRKESAFFSEEKTQKTFISGAVPRAGTS